MVRCKKCGGMRGGVGPGFQALVGNREVIAADLASLRAYNQGQLQFVNPQEQLERRRMTVVNFIRNNMDRFAHYRQIVPAAQYQPFGLAYQAVLGGQFQTPDLIELFRVANIVKDY